MVFGCIKEHLQTELSSEATTAERLRRDVRSFGAVRLESDRPLWRAVVLSGAMDPVRSPEIRRPEEIAVSLLREILAEGQNLGELTKDFPVAHLAEVDWKDFTRRSFGGGQWALPDLRV